LIAPLAALLVVLLSPVLAITALAVRLDVLAAPLRLQQRTIEIHKFRSVHVGLSYAHAVRLVSKGDPASPWTLHPKDAT
jgi:lipopolysaccharide/colanic/teichoic acid biosynthesis glycosyltransferase